ncbi:MULTISPECIES: hypothetical protein [unclassified Variovorax]|uniref:hypothetical protein n=1 Tax=unclassified Variovorax TaxID=663243 RepID=UPI00257736E1|nr:MULTISPECIES: hypothetical protein [unclassified Variovorax]MDM0086743.1 hypothetical protein [Variovorax sp. J22G40]MDM0145001.1 hypothetical protein [Variovorax sp. J2P1-31]
MSEGTWYRTGLVSLANGSDLVAGVGTEFIANVLPGAIFFAPEGLYEVERAVSDTQLKLVKAYAGPTVAGAEFAIAPTQGAVVQATKQLQAFLSELGELKQAWESGELDPKGLATKGVKNSVEDLPAIGNTPGDAWLVDGVLYMWTGSAWSNQGSTVTTPELEAVRDQAIAAKDTSQAIAVAFGDVAGAVGAATTQADISTGQAVAAKAAALAAAAAQTGAATSRDAAQLYAGIYPTTAAGLAATGSTANKFFSTPVPGSVDALILWENVGGVATERTRFASSDAVRKPVWTGKRSAWVDPFFRRSTPGVNVGSRKQWMSLDGANYPWTLVANPVFNGKAIRRSLVSNVQLSGPVLWYSDIGAAPGDTVTVCALFVGTGGVVQMPTRSYTAGNVAAEGQANATTEAGAGTITTTAQPQLLRRTFVIPATGDFLFLYPYSNTPSTSFDIVSLWMFKGDAAGPVWPPMADDAGLEASVTALAEKSAATDASLLNVIPSVAYAIGSKTAVTASATSIVGALTGPSTAARDLPFRGWGNLFTPSGVSFNAIRVKTLSRVAGVAESSRASKLCVVVRTGATPAGGDSTVVAVGSALVNPADETLKDVIIVLKHPTTGAVRMLSDADFGAQYFIAVYAENAVGGAAAMGEPRGTNANVVSTSQTYYTILPYDPKTAAYLAGSPGAGSAAGFEHLALTNPVEVINYFPSAPFVEAAVDPTLPPRIKSLEDSVKAPVAYAFDTTTAVTATATDVVIAGSTFSSQPRDLPFSGWGEVFTPGGVSFNAVRIKALTRAAAAAAKWRTLNVMVRTAVGGNPQTNGTVVAVGSIVVKEDANDLADITILLRDPSTGAVKTLSDASFTDGKYFIGVYARTAAGAQAAMGEPRGTLSNSALSSWYTTSNAPLTAGWAIFGSGSVRIGFQHLMLTNPAEVSVVSPTTALVAAVAASIVPPTTALDIVVPPHVYGVVGSECNVYLDNLFFDSARDYFLDVTSAVGNGQQQEERWTWTPAAAQATGSLTFAVHEKRTGALLVSKSTIARAAALNAGAGVTQKVLRLGDSLVNAGVVGQTLLDRAAADVMKIELLGTRGTGLNRHEGRGGWSIADYSTAGRTNYSFTVSGVTTAPAINSTTYTNNGNTYTVQEVALTGGAGTIICSVDPLNGAPTASGVLTKGAGAGDVTIAFSAFSTVPGNPFWRGGALNFGQYLTDFGVAVPDWVFPSLGINDVFSVTSDALAIATATSAFTNLDALLASIKAAGPGIRIGLVIPTPPAASQDAFGYAYGTGQPRFRDKRNIMFWVQQLIAKYAGQEANRIHLVPSNVALDTVSNYPLAAAAPVNSRNAAVQVQRQNNGVHPATSGYQQLGDAEFAFLKYHA